MLVATIDTGTTNTRACLWRDGQVVGEAAAATGVRDTATTGSTARLKSGVARALADAAHAAGAEVRDVARIIASGMITSNIGLFEITHVLAPAGVAEFAAAMREATIAEVAAQPIWFVPGVKNPPPDDPVRDFAAIDFMRGEEVEALALAERLALRGPAVIVLPGSHNKFVALDSQQRIARCITTLSGELVAALTGHTVLAATLEGSFAKSIDPDWLLRGARLAREQGLARAAFAVRAVGLFAGASRDQCANVLLGAVLAGDVQALAAGLLTSCPAMRRSSSPASRWPRRSLASQPTTRAPPRAYARSMLHMQSTSPAGARCASQHSAVSSSLRLQSSRVHEEAGARGRIRTRLNMPHQRHDIVSRILDAGIVAVIRADSADVAEKTAQACLAGGITVMEVALTTPGGLALIEKLQRTHAGDGALIGAGTVLDAPTARLAIDAGARYIVTPALDEEAVRLANRYQIPSLPGAMTVREIVAALEAGADIVKLFPARAWGRRSCVPRLGGFRTLRSCRPAVSAPTTPRNGSPPARSRSASAEASPRRRRRRTSLPSRNERGRLLRRCARHAPLPRCASSEPASGSAALDSDQWLDLRRLHAWSIGLDLAQGRRFAHGRQAAPRQVLVGEGALELPGHLLVLQLSQHLGGHPGGEDARRDLHSAGHEGAGRDDGLRPHFGFIHHDRVHADKRIASHDAAVEDGAVADVAVLFDDRVPIGKAVHDAGVLDVRTPLRTTRPKSPRRQAHGPT